MLETASWSSKTSASGKPECMPSRVAPPTHPHCRPCPLTLSCAVVSKIFLILMFSFCCFTTSIFIYFVAGMTISSLCVSHLLLRAALWHLYPFYRKESLGWVTCPGLRAHKGCMGFNPILSDLTWVLLSRQCSSLPLHDWWPFPHPLSEKQKIAFYEWS